MKKCYTCQTTKPLTEYNKNKGRKDGLNSICRECSAKRSRQFYADNREAHIVLVSKNKKRYILELQTIANERKSAGCPLCPERDIICMDFHHRDSELKEHLISQLIHDAAKRKFLIEIEKCVVVCSNCHRKIHAGKIVL